MPIIKIISGGQTGADRGGLDAAIEYEIPHGWLVPEGAYRRGWDHSLQVRSNGDGQQIDKSPHLHDPINPLRPVGPTDKRLAAGVDILPDQIILNVAGGRESRNWEIQHLVYGTMREVLNSVNGFSLYPFYDEG